MSDITAASCNSAMTLREKFEARRSQSCLLLDVSTSMTCYIEPGMRKIDALRDVVSGLKGNPLVIAFDTEARMVTLQTVPNPSGCTNMARAINLAKSMGHNKAVMITDGEATDKTLALLAVQDFELKIMYVGAGPEPEFLNTLAAASKNGGKATTEDLKQTKQLAAKVQLLLGAAAPGPNKGAIEL